MPTPTIALRVGTTPPIPTNSLKNGDWVLLRTGWLAQIRDNMRGNTRLCDVWGFSHEMGSVYSHDILYKIPVTLAADGTPSIDTTRESIEIAHTKSQVKLRDTITTLA